MKSNKNLLFANQQLEEAYGYQEAKGHCKWEMDKVDNHMQETLTTLKIYEVLLNEQKGKLERILYIEGAKVNNNEYHRKSLMEIDETKELIESISGFMKIPMSDEGKLAEASIEFLEHIKMKANKILTRLY
jgi:tRNA U34 5-carboxymethylaminomethyl modifying enzyme MnmG/GidA